MPNLRKPSHACGFQYDQKARAVNGKADYSCCRTLIVSGGKPICNTTGWYAC